jgi:hypothetical protein
LCCKFIQLTIVGSAPGQGDQIGRIFAYWVLFSVDSFCENYKYIPNSWTTFSTLKAMYVVIFSKNGFGYILGNFLTNASGHPALKSLFFSLKSLQRPKDVTRFVLILPNRILSQLIGPKTSKSGIGPVLSTSSL